ncbi:Hsp20/alpha crystallin family protein [Bacillus sp. T33-2]|uniref:Hsp20/alpha crystallin family protein n=1 Tax=Bacillus sp. T33-2 TaxID=2054168 RepID=UPI000C76FF39|nr:Hsp20/alpha crystallin family protein [Bacillus sp. T33-2]PLR98855.1 spore coat protein [Bacillus sp. T33-2]
MFPWNFFPFDQNMKSTFQNMKPDEIEKYIQDVMGKVFPSHILKMGNPQDWFKDYSPLENEAEPEHTVRLEASIFETHDYVYIRVPVKEKDWLRQMKIHYTPNQMTIEHIPAMEDKQVFIFPAAVKKKGGSAHYKEGILEVKIPKSVHMECSEIDVTDIVQE